MKLLRRILDRLDALSLRERLAVFAACLLVSFYVWDFAFMQALYAEEKRIKSEVSRKTSEQQSIRSQVQNLHAQKSQDPNELNRQKLRKLKKQLGEIENQLQASTNQLVSPRDMACILESVLLKVKGLRLLSVKGLGGEPVVPLAMAENEASIDEEVQQAPTVPSLVDNAYKHGLRIEFEGDYLNTLEYVRELEALEWDFFWDSLEFSVEEYPDSKIVITVFTLSLDENWIGV